MAESCTFGTENFIAEEWKSWCRLCARANSQYINIISGQSQLPTINNREYDCSTIAPFIEDFFRVDIKEDEKLSQLVCTDCYQVTGSIIKFKERVNKVQQMYDDLKCNKYLGKLNSNALHQKYDLFEIGPFIISYANKLPVEEIFVADLPVTTASQSSVIEIKSEKNADEMQTDILSVESEKIDEFKDPFGDADSNSGDPDYSPVESSDDEDSDEDFEAKKDESKNVKKRSKIISNTSTHGLEYDFSCKICTESFKYIRDYGSHTKNAHGEVICPHCPDTFKNTYKLKSHMKVHPKSFSCSHCDTNFATRQRLERHIKCKHEARPSLICEVCGVTLLTKKQLSDHMLQHTDYAPFECKVCGGCFKLRKRLKTHMQIHGDKHICPKCGKQLSTRAILKSHLLVHSDKMSHKCDFCGRLFKRSNTLKNHIIAHTDLRPYKCDFCDKSFSTGPSCRFHKKTMHPRELAELEATGAKAYTKNIPKLHVLKEVSKTGKNLKPLASKQNGFAYFDKEFQHKAETTDTQPAADNIICNYALQNTLF